MTDALAATRPGKAEPTPLGKRFKFMPLPIMPHHAQWFEAGPVTLGVEARVIDDGRGGASERSASIHVFNAGRTEEYLRFDCFGRFPHYHYILNAEQHNVSWGYDTDANGPMLPWALNAIRTRLPFMLRRAGAAELADRVEREGFDISVLDKIAQAVARWSPRPATEMMEEARSWYDRWKSLHPQFDTAD